MRYIGEYIVVALILVLPYSIVKSSTNQIVFNQISIEQKLPGSNVFLVYQDHYGIMWFAIESVGLCKYDGVNYTVYENIQNDSSSLSNNYTRCIIEDNDGYLWVGTSEGLNRFDRKKGVFVRYFHNENDPFSLSNDFIMDLIIDKHGGIWVGTRFGVCKYIKETNNFRRMYEPENIGGNVLVDVVSDLFEDEKGNIWIGSYSRGIFMLSSERNKKYRDALTTNKKEKLFLSRYWKPTIKGVPNSTNISVQSICEYDSANLLLGKFDGLFSFNLQTEEFTKFSVDQEAILSSFAQKSIIKDSRGFIWAGSSTKGLYLIDPKERKIKWINNQNSGVRGLKSNTIRGIFEDNSGLIWIATKFHGIQTYDRRQEVLTKHELNNELNTEDIRKGFVLSLLEDSKGNIWIGTKNKGLFIYNTKNKKIKSIQKPAQNSLDLKSNRIECIVEDKKGNIWVGTLNGICRLNYSGEVIECYNDIFIRSLLVDQNNNLWAGTNSVGILFFDSNRNVFRRYSESINKSLFLSNTLGIRGLDITSDNLLWVSTYQNGVYKYDLSSDSLNLFSHNHSGELELGTNMVRGVFEDDKGKIWVGTKSNGLYVYESENDRFLKVLEDYSDLNTVYNIMQDKSGKYWLGTHNGIIKMNPDNNDIQVFDKSYGVRNNVIEINAAIKTRDGLFIYGGSDGINVFDPSDVDKLEIPFSVYIPSVKVYDSVFAEDIITDRDVEIGYDDKFVLIEFAVSDYSEPLKIKYKYKLQGFDNNWIYSENRNFTSYTALPSGKYEFLLMAANSDNVWTKEPLKFNLIVTSPFWRKPYFVFIVLAVFILLISLGYIIRIRFIRKNEIKLQKLVDAKTTDLMELNQELEEHKENLEVLVEERTEDLNIARKKAEDSDKLKSAFLANMSHEIRTPLNAIIGLSRVLVDEKGQGSDNLRLSEMISSNARSLQQLVDDIIDISKIEANKIKIFKDAFPVNKCLRNIVDIYKHQIELYNEYMNVEVVLEMPQEEKYLKSDQARIEQIVKNLINNALKFTKQGKVTVGYSIVQGKEEKIQFFVNDTGTGISKEEASLVFQRFKKSETKENVMKGGTGLGLSISYNLTVLLGGKMWVESELNVGSTFYFELPLEEEDEMTIEELQASLQIEPVYDWMGKTVLIIESNEASYLVLENIVKKSNINILRAETGKVAISILKNNKSQGIDMVLMEVELPDIDGFSLVRMIKTINKKIPILAQTSYAMNHEERKILDSDFDEFLAKPINEILLLEKMAQFLS